MSEDSNYDRRCFLGAAAMTIAATTLVMSDAAHAQSSTTTAADATTMGPGTHTSFGPLKQIDAGLLNVGYAEAGPTPLVVISTVRLRTERNPLIFPSSF